MNYHLEGYELRITTWACETCGACAQISQLFTCDVLDGQRRQFVTPRGAPFYSGAPIVRDNRVVWTNRCTDCIDRPAEPVPEYLKQNIPLAEPETLEDLDL